MPLDELELSLFLFFFSVLNKVELTAGQMGQNIRKYRKQGPNG